MLSRTGCKEQQHEFLGLAKATKNHQQLGEEMTNLRASPTQSANAEEVRTLPRRGNWHRVEKIGRDNV